MLDFPVMADFSELICGEKRFFLTHGHLWNENNLPSVPANTVIAHGHTHIAVNKILDNGMTIFNPGSISLPKNTIVRTFGVFDGEKLSVLELETGKEFPALR